jgi:hypothetical protein
MNAILMEFTPQHRLSLDVRDTGEFECALIHDRLADRLEAVVWIVFPISCRDIRPCVSRVRPVSCSNPPLIRVLLSDKILLGGVADRHVASVHRKPWLVRLRSEVVVRCA